MIHAEVHGISQNPGQRQHVDRPFCRLVTQVMWMAVCVVCCRQRVLGENSLEVATTWLNLGGVLRAAGKLEEAESACRQCLDIRERQLGSQHTDTAAAQIG